jgi:hypothetical protein
MDDYYRSPEKKPVERLGMVAHAYNPCWLGGKDWEDHSPRTTWAKCSRGPTSTSTCWIWWHPPIILTMQEPLIEEPQSSWHKSDNLLEK